MLGRLDVGVAVFFVLSGFLLYPPPVPVGRYALRRAARILPAYWVLLAVVAAFCSVPGAYWWLGQTYVGEPLAGPLTQTWSLCTEVAFYAVLPGLVWLARRWEWPVLAGCGVVAYGWIVGGAPLGDPAYATSTQPASTGHSHRRASHTSPGSTA